MADGEWAGAELLVLPKAISEPASATAGIYFTADDFNRV